MSKAESELDRVVRYFEESDTNSIESRYLSERDRDYYDSKQWTADEEAEMERRSQPIITINRIKPKVDFLLGMERSQRTAPKAFPRTPVHEDASEAATDGLEILTLRDYGSGYSCAIFIRNCLDEHMIKQNRDSQSSYPVGLNRKPTLMWHSFNNGLHPCTCLHQLVGR